MTSLANATSMPTCPTLGTPARTPARQRTAAAVSPRGAGPARAAYLRVLVWAFTFFNSVRVAAYVPTMLAIWSSGDSSQHSLWTWCTWFGANLTMAAWVYETSGQKLNRVAGVNLCNALMCAAVVVLILIHRF